MARVFRTSGSYLAVDNRCAPRAAARFVVGVTGSVDAAKRAVFRRYIFQEPPRGAAGSDQTKTTRVINFDDKAPETITLIYRKPRCSI